MGQKVTIDRLGSVAILRLSNPPRNYLGPLVRADLSAALTKAEGDVGVTGIVLSGVGGLFSYGHNPVRPDLREGTPSLAQLCLQIEDCKKPVVACVFGLALGAGFELALAAHARVALSGTRIGLTDIANGYIPGAGGTQRLPRLVGGETALRMLQTGQILDVADPQLSALFDEVVQTDAETAAVALLNAIIDSGDHPTKTRDRVDGFADPAAYQKAIAKYRAALGTAPRLVHRAVLETVEAAQLLPFEAGAALEEALYGDCAQSDEAQGLLHLALAQRRTTNLPEATNATARKVSVLGIIGSGPSARALVAAALQAGLAVLWFERDVDAVERALKRLEYLFETEKVPPETQSSWMLQLVPIHRLDDLAEADVVIEAVADTPHTKSQVMRALSRFMPQQAVLVAHSATQSVDQIAKDTGRAGQILGLHLIPAPLRARVAEIIPGSETDPESVVTLHAVLERLKINPVWCGSRGGSIGMRMLAAQREAANFALRLGASPAQVDTALLGFGMSNGVFAPLDMVGFTSELSRMAQLHNREQYPLEHLARLSALINEGRKGRGDGGGFYDWDDNRPNPRDTDQPGRNAPDAQRLQHLMLGAMMNEGARLLREGVALRPSDIDLVMVRNYGFPAWRGGPMNAADRIGLFTLARAMKPHAKACPRLFAADPGIEALIRNGETLDVLNGVGANRRQIAG